MNDASLVSRGRIEIGDELLWIDSVDRANNTCVVAPYGRGLDGTTATAHTSLSRVVVQPLYPRQGVKDTINQVIGGLGNQLFAVESATLIANPRTVSYDLPIYTQRVLNVLAANFSSYDDSEYVRRWKFDPQSTASATNKSLYVYDPTMSGMNLYVTFFRSPMQLVAGDTFADTLLPETSYDVIILGAAARLMSTATSYLASTRAVEPGALNKQVDPNQITQQSRYLYTLFQQRLEEEKVQILHSYVTRAHYTG